MVKMIKNNDESFCPIDSLALKFFEPKTSINEDNGNQKEKK